MYSFSKISFLLCGVSLNFTFIVTRLIAEVSSLPLYRVIAILFYHFYNFHLWIFRRFLLYQIFVTLFYDFCNKWFFQEQNSFVILFDDFQRNFIGGFNFQSRKSFLLYRAFDKIILFYDFCNSFIGKNSMIIFMAIPLMCNSYWIGRFEWEKWRPFVHLGQGYLLVIWF